MWYTFILLFFRMLALENYCQNIDNLTQASSVVVRRLTHIPDCEGSIPTGYNYFRHHFLNYIFF